jgi:hypothetical protein
MAIGELNPMTMLIVFVERVVSKDAACCRGAIDLFFIQFTLSSLLCMDSKWKERWQML